MNRADAYALLIERGVPGTVYNIASGVARTMRVVLEALIRRSRVPVTIEVDSSRLRPQKEQCKVVLAMFD